MLILLRSYPQLTAFGRKDCICVCYVNERKEEQRYMEKRMQFDVKRLVHFAHDRIIKSNMLFTLTERKKRSCWIQKSDRPDIEIKKTRCWTQCVVGRLPHGKPIHRTFAPGCKGFQGNGTSSVSKVSKMACAGETSCPFLTDKQSVIDTKYLAAQAPDLAVSSLSLLDNYICHVSLIFGTT
jgi:hypothetical protein